MWKSVRAFDHDASNSNTYVLSDDPSRGSRSDRRHGINGITRSNPLSRDQSETEALRTPPPSVSESYPVGQRNARTFVMARAQPIPNDVPEHRQAMPATPAAASLRQEQPVHPTWHVQAESQPHTTPHYEQQPAYTPYVQAQTQAQLAYGAGYAQHATSYVHAMTHQQQAQPFHETSYPHQQAPAGHAATYGPPPVQSPYGTTWPQSQPHSQPPRNMNGGHYSPADPYVNQDAARPPYFADFVHPLTPTRNYFARGAIIGYVVGSMIVGVVVYKVMTR